MGRQKGGDDAFVKNGASESQKQIGLYCLFDIFCFALFTHPARLSRLCTSEFNRGAVVCLHARQVLQGRSGVFQIDGRPTVGKPPLC